MKTGHTQAAGYGLTATAMRDGRRLILVLNGLESTRKRAAEAERLINYFVGQVVGSMNDIRSVRSVIEEMVQEYVDTMERLDGWAAG